MFESRITCQGNGWQSRLSYAQGKTLVRIEAPEGFSARSTFLAFTKSRIAVSS
jgi:hypothetical protein